MSAITPGSWLVGSAGTGKPEVIGSSVGYALVLTEPINSRIVGNSHLILRCQGGLVFSGAHNGQGTITVVFGTTASRSLNSPKRCVFSVSQDWCNRGLWCS